MATGNRDANQGIPELDPARATLSPEQAQEREEQEARHLAERCRLQFVDLTSFQPDQDLFRSVPVELMFRYNFLPYKKENGTQDFKKTDDIHDSFRESVGIKFLTHIGGLASSPWRGRVEANQPYVEDAECDDDL